MEYGRKWNGTADYSMNLVEGERRSVNPLDGDYSSNLSPDGKSHFKESGVIEGDCLLCHTKTYSFGARNQQINARNYRWAATAGAGLGKIEGAIFTYKDPDAVPGSKDFMVGTWNFSDRPIVSYHWEDRNIFDRSGRLNGSIISKTVATKNCLQCHKGPDEKKVGWVHKPEFDAHVKAGFQCTDCHGLVGTSGKERLEHQIAKGWHPLGSVRNDLDGMGMKTCAACHLEGKYRPTRPGMPEKAKNPSAVHQEKFPGAMFHFDMISCANCHSTRQPALSGYLLDMAMGKQVWYTAATLETITWSDDFGILAPEPWTPWITRYDARNGLGEQYIPVVSKVAQWFGEKTDMMEVRPIILKYVKKAYDGIPEPTLAAVRDVNGNAVKRPTIATDDTIKAMIEALTEMGFSNVVFVSDRIYELKDGVVVSYDDPFTTHPHNFPVHHNIVPVEKRMTYGSKGKPRGCYDCHSDTSVFFTKMIVSNPGRFLTQDYPTPREPNAEPQMYHWGFEEVPVPDEITDIKK
ncbi:MAG: hypothetical protein JXO48_09150 [Deltaproteobacteria bacterium]|nr:hypothetical protein [Deltaproteobacteria bacterium]